MMEISIIIPTYNSVVTLRKLLASIDFAQAEVIVVDDCSTDDTAGLKDRYPGMRYFAMPTHSGPAAARNYGVARSTGEILLFFDADVVLREDTLERFRECFADPEIKVAVGRYSRAPANDNWFARYKALLTYCWAVRGPYFSCFEPNCGGLRREVFDRVGGFDERYHGPLVEDYDFGYRIWACGYKILMCPEIVVAHHFPGFLRNARNYWHRSAAWVQLQGRKPKLFDQGSAAGTDAFAAAAAGGFFLALAVSFIYPMAVVGSLAMLVLAVAVYGRFYRSAAARYGLAFALYALALNLINGVVILGGAAQGASLRLFSRRLLKNLRM